MNLTQKLKKAGQSSGDRSRLFDSGGGGRCVSEVQLFSRLKTNSLAGRDVDFGAGAWVSPDPRFSRPHVKNTKPPKFDPVSLGEGLLEALEDRVNRRFGLISRQACPADYVVDNILLDQRALLGKSAGSSIHPRPMLDSLEGIVNAPFLP